MTAIEPCAVILSDPLVDVMFAASGDLLQRAEYAQPALFALQYSLAELLRWYGIEPRCLIGQGVGEFAAGCIAGVLSLEDGIALAAGKPRQHLRGKIPGHHPTLQPIGQASDQTLTNEFLVQQYSGEGIAAPKTVPAAMRAEFEKQCDIIVEVGPNGNSSHSNQDGASKPGSETIPTLRRGENDWIALLETLARLYVRGAPVDWAIFQDGQRRSPVHSAELPIPTFASLVSGRAGIRRAARNHAFG